MTLEQLRIFVAVAELEHIRRASETLNLSQSAVSSAIAALETRHAVTLFDRVGRSIVLNQTGRDFLGEAKAVLDRAKAAEAALTDLSVLLRGRLSIMASQTIASYWLPRLLVAYHAEYPHIDVDVTFANTNGVAAAIESGGAELGLVEGLVDSPALASDPVGHDVMDVVVAVGHPWASGTNAQLDAVPWVVREQGSGTREAFEQMAQGKHLPVAMVLPGNEAVLEAVEAGLGASLMSRLVARTRLEAGTLQIVPGWSRAREFHVLHHKERYRTRASSAFLEVVAKSQPAKINRSF
ncbi:LysR family transcriptional regulator [Pelagibacterium nitratireducens]|uniref:LysR family transcriptional regulator n=1 Tax=Pelagibacterium nitratireducens TaxID=1046114 RepID=A0ABZ2HY11_9HYPH